MSSKLFKVEYLSVPTVHFLSGRSFGFLLDKIEFNLKWDI